jgi:hypothetical protein
MQKYNNIQYDSKLLSGLPWSVIWGKLNTAWTSYVPRKAGMLKLFSILQYWFYKWQNFLSYTSIFCKQFCIVVSVSKIIGHGKPDNNLESPYALKHTPVGVENFYVLKMFTALYGTQKTWLQKRQPLVSNLKMRIQSTNFQSSSLRSTLILSSYPHLHQPTTLYHRSFASKNACNSHLPCNTCHACCMPYPYNPVYFIIKNQKIWGTAFPSESSPQMPSMQVSHTHAKLQASVLWDVPLCSPQKICWRLVEPVALEGEIFPGNSPNNIALIPEVGHCSYPRLWEPQILPNYNAVHIDLYTRTFRQQTWTHTLHYSGKNVRVLRKFAFLLFGSSPSNNHSDFFAELQDVPNTARDVQHYTIKLAAPISL